MTNALSWDEDGVAPWLERCDSPIEDDWLWHAAKYMRGGVQIVPQCEVSTNGRARRLDFLVSDTEHAVGVECDGKKFHRDAEADAQRDEAILATGVVRTIYHFRGTDIFCRVNTCLSALQRLEPWMFREISRHNLRRLARFEDGPAIITVRTWCKTTVFRAALDREAADEIPESDSEEGA